MKRDRGFTLLEVMVSLVVLSLIVVALMGTQAGALRLAGRHRSDTLASELATAKLAEALLVPPEELAPDNGEGEGTYGRFTWVRAVHPTDEEGLTRVRITVRWDDTHEVAVETLVTAADVEY